LNVETAAGLKIFNELAKWADVLVEDHMPREAKKLGIDYKTLRKINPGLIVTSITPFGQTGPYRDYRACDLVTFHTSGQGYISPGGGVDSLDEPPIKDPLHSADFMGGLSASVGTMSAVITKQTTGKGQHVDLSKQEALSSIIRREFGVFTCENVPYLRPKDAPTRTGGSSLYPCKDGFVVLALTDDNFWLRGVEMMGNPEWTQNDFCKDRTTRRENGDVIDMFMTEWTQERTMEEINQAAITYRIPCSPVRSIDKIVSDEQLAVREYFVDIEHKVAGTARYTGAPCKMSETPWRVKSPAPLLGEHNEQVYCGMLGYSRQDLVKMRQAGVI
ncbi:MAG: CoA transferase, partial [Dehalococcoidales bacterium]|nr:CoA transferase [Dehalococcoidales bacterium]